MHSCHLYKIQKLTFLTPIWQPQNVRRPVHRCAIFAGHRGQVKMNESAIQLTWNEKAAASCGTKQLSAVFA